MRLRIGIGIYVVALFFPLFKIVTAFLIAFYAYPILPFIIYTEARFVNSTAFYALFVEKHEELFPITFLVIRGTVSFCSNRSLSFFMASWYLPL